MLAAAGADFTAVVKLTYYMIDIASLPALRAVRDAYIDIDNPPASTAVEVRKLFREDVLLEVDAVAVAGLPES